MGLPILHKFCQVALPVPLEGPFTYRIPPEMDPLLAPGVRVIVPFGARKLTGVVTGFTEGVPAGLAEGAVKNVERVLDAEPALIEELLKLGRWVADYYLAPEGEVLRAMLPLGVEVETRRVVRLTAAGQRFVSPVVDALRRRPLPEAALRRRFQLTDGDLRKLERGGVIERVSEARDRKERENALLALPEKAPPESADVPAGRREQRVLQLLISAGAPLAAPELASRARVSAALLRRMVDRGSLTVVPAPGAGAPATDSGETSSPPAVAVRPSSHVLDPRQQAALAALREMLGRRQYAAALLYGVTGSGKTEVYMEAIADVARAGGAALMLVPEIALTPAMAEQFQARFGETVAILHSAFGGRERSREWRRVRRGEARVVVGTRSAVFSPIERPGIIIVDEDHDPS